MIVLRRTAVPFAVVTAAILLIVSQPPHARAQQSQSSHSAPQHHDHDSMPGMAMDEAMSGEHMFMTDPRPANPSDDQRAAALVVIVRDAISKYKDYKVRHELQLEARSVAHDSRKN